MDVTLGINRETQLANRFIHSALVFKGGNISNELGSYYFQLWHTSEILSSTRKHTWTSYPDLRCNLLRGGYNYIFHPLWKIDNKYWVKINIFIYILYICVYIHMYIYIFNIYVYIHTPHSSLGPPRVPLLTPWSPAQPCWQSLLVMLTKLGIQTQPAYPLDLPCKVNFNLPSGHQLTTATRIFSISTCYCQSHKLKQSIQLHHGCS